MTILPHVENHWWIRKILLLTQTHTHFITFHVVLTHTLILHSVVHLCGSSIRNCLVCSSSFFRHWYLALTSLMRCCRCSSRRSFALTYTTSWHTHTQIHRRHTDDAAWSPLFILSLFKLHIHTHIYSHLITSQRDHCRLLSVTELLHWSSRGLSGLLKAAAEKIYISWFSLPPLCLKLSMFLPLNTERFEETGTPKICINSNSKISRISL